MPRSNPTSPRARRPWRGFPTSLLGRVLLLTLVAMASAQVISSLAWVATFRAQQVQGLLATTRNLAQSVAATAQFFDSLPLEYRHIVLDQLRNMGGTRFFVSLNERRIDMTPLPDTERKRLVIGEVESVLRKRLGNRANLHVEFVHPDNLRILNNELPLDALPRSWAHYALTLEPLNPPVLVTQIEVAEHEWLYLAAALPAPYVSLEDEGIPKQQLLFLVVMIAILFPVLAWLIRQQTRPLRTLAGAVRELPLDDQAPPLPERGSAEIVAVTRGFNAMRRRLQSYINDRNQLFRSISHDLKTPITRLRLRVDLLEDDTMRERLEADLQELELLVKSALQTIRDTEIHENAEWVDLTGLLRGIVDAYPGDDAGPVTLTGQCRPYRGKPLALKRCFGNLVDNAVKYGRRPRVRIEDGADRLTVHVEDDGPGIPEPQLSRIFEPYVRLDTHRHGHGLGLGIARNIAQSHGGDLTLGNRPEGGLRVTVTLPRHGSPM
ncbi:ATP-binding protein [Marinobacter lutaoensis]|uniref:histidine kinase n=1 Tax=Marinobacter lutaoensis TaxID=135739 RepID=A0A1V2DQU0_9GAMM|nr:ATP-binding protein [Marinobacter lutaoensis]MBE02799.1 two-component sensor histidine kinase [Marinobacter sp.]MBI44303.1 two-component sensor histidine kinase [Oceanospirillales bacterium]ONF43034.1 two-component sensor histidine kinase [Marinobacter lutaoensis]